MLHALRKWARPSGCGEGGTELESVELSCSAQESGRGRWVESDDADGGAVAEEAEAAVEVEV